MIEILQRTSHCQCQVEVVDKVDVDGMLVEHGKGSRRCGWHAMVLIASRFLTSASSSVSMKELLILRHGQATHNPRAEAARSKGCSWEEFLSLMKDDDSLDAELTPLGRQQAREVHLTHKAALAGVDVVVSSPLSRALQTADLAAPTVARRVVHESFREINGLLLNAKRRSRSELSTRFPHWDLDLVQDEHDTTWTTDLESQSDCGERGYRGLLWLRNRQENRILLVAHGGLLRFAMAEHPNVYVQDGRSSTSDKDRNSDTTHDEARMVRPPNARFANCELRRYRIEWDDAAPPDETQSASALTRIHLTELDLESVCD